VRFAILFSRAARQSTTGIERCGDVAVEDRVFGSASMA